MWGRIIMPWYNSVTGEHVYSPSDSNQKDELVYKASIYAKEELPTWSEIYEEFYLNKCYSCDINKKEDQLIDLYWKIPHKTFLISVICNQFNKMIYEDNLKDKIIDKLNHNIDKEIVGIRFKYGTMEDIYYHIIEYSHVYQNKVFDNAPSIYTIPMPNGKPNPFITSKHHRLDVSQIQYPNRIYPVLQVKSTKLDGYAIYSPNIDTKDFEIIISIMMEQYIEYFSGTIGWKDNDNNIEYNNSSRHCTAAGYDTK